MLIPTQMKTTQKNTELLKSQMKKLGLDFFLIPNSDEFASEYLPEYAKRLQFVTGFTGSNAFAIIGQKKSAFWTDGRYTLQAAAEVDADVFEIYNLADKSPLAWLRSLSPSPSHKIGFDPKLHSINSIKNYQKYFGENLISLEQNPIDSIWQSQPQKLQSKIFEHQIKYCGESSADKIKKIIAVMDQKTDAIILTNPTSVCWLFNIRASDIEYSPLLLSYAIIHSSGKAKLFDEASLKSEIKNSKNIQLDFNQANYWLCDVLQKQKINIIDKTDPCLIHKAIKNKTEIKNAIKAHQLDGLAVTRFLFWLENSLSKKQKLDEISVAEKLLEFRKAGKEFFYPSFATIAGFGSNGAIVHYHASKKTNKIIKGNSLFLIDSGGQYLEGTTDVTRTIAVGKPSKEMIRNFTLVLKGHIAIALAKFPAGTTGNNLDILARYNLWQNGLDYEHGTGHGVGSFSSVHESPPSISKRSDGVALQEGMILSNEPGYYKTGEYGIRIENLILVEKCEEKTAKFLQFKTLTLVPIDPKLVDFEMLSKQEKSWLSDYHSTIYKELKSDLKSEEKKWLEKIVGIYSK
ncbi:MAG: putative peptidase [Rickettsiaceae bacterium]|jgi:Xaa-Pro aminopeptidase|nr:putative peptidase [Rickettsiaceae bacterium]